MSDEGITLVELIIAMLVGVIVSGLTVLILVNTWGTQKDVVSESLATTRGQLVASTLERSMRNALAFDVSADGTTLRVRTSLNDNLVCQGFAISAAAGAQFIQTSSTLPAAGTWPVWQSDVAVHGSAPFITRTLNGVAYNFDLTTDGARVHFAGTTTGRNLTGVTAPCW
ncbi:hypothetical protein [Microbacterium kribbense]|uniref:PilW family protein n=1 Tax=Microbacterium kribbense TaxID=433645 RepID=UPI0031D70060